MKKMIVTIVLAVVCIFANAQTLGINRTRMYEVTTVEQLLATYGDAYITRTYWLDTQWFYCQTADGRFWKADAGCVEGACHYKAGKTIMQNYQERCMRIQREQMAEIGMRTLPAAGVGYPVVGAGVYGGSGISVRIGGKKAGVGFSIGNGGISAGVNSKHFNAGVSLRLPKSNYHRNNNKYVFDAATGTIVRR